MNLMLLVLLTISSSYSPISRNDLCVTNGAVTATSDGRMAIDTPSSRAVLRLASEPAAEIRFRYLGPSAGSKPLGSGEMRRQIGLKLRSLDQCNLLYVMWHIEPDSKIAVSIKRNPGQNTHEECEDHGYINFKPTKSSRVAPIAEGESHTLRAELRGSKLEVFADNHPAWEGDLGAKIYEIDGPVGLRTDNARFVFDYFARGVRGKPIPCKP